MNTFKVNTLETNRNLVYPYDEIETAINLTQPQYKFPRERVLRTLLGALKVTQHKNFKDHQVKIGLLYQAVAEYFIKRRNPALADYYLEKAKEILEPLHLLDAHLEEEIHY